MRLAPPPSQETLNLIIAQTCDTVKLEEQLAREALARDAALARLNQLITTNTTHTQDQDTYQHTFDQLQADYEHYAQRCSDLETQTARLKKSATASNKPTPTAPTTPTWPTPTTHGTRSSTTPPSTPAAPSTSNSKTKPS
ncbi:hypothetical protein [Arcanobacterium phocae]|uniref:hypothetical protein n=1 Tax=Arcanobacterium phocae TaxID=131112 RepID=UPI001C0F3475|nr:hypothetical protein [Arcanobacterium phocae]